MSALNIYIGCYCPKSPIPYVTAISKQHHKKKTLNSFLASGYFCHLLMTFANSLDPDQDRHFVSPDLDGKPFDSESVPEIIF